MTSESIKRMRKAMIAKASKGLSLFELKQIIHQVLQIDSEVTNEFREWFIKKGNELIDKLGWTGSYPKITGMMSIKDHMEIKERIKRERIFFVIPECRFYHENGSCTRFEGYPCNLVWCIEKIEKENSKEEGGAK